LSLVSSDSYFILFTFLVKTYQLCILKLFFPLNRLPHFLHLNGFRILEENASTICLHLFRDQDFDEGLELFWICNFGFCLFLCEGWNFQDFQNAKRNQVFIVKTESEFFKES